MTPFSIEHKVSKKGIDFLVSQSHLSSSDSDSGVCGRVPAVVFLLDAMMRSAASGDQCDQYFVDFSAPSVPASPMGAMA